MSPQEAETLALAFLSQKGLVEVAATRVMPVPGYEGFVVFYESKLALEGDLRERLFGNLPVVIDAVRREAAFCGATPSFERSAADWLKARAFNQTN